MNTRTRTASAKQARFIERLMIQREVPTDFLVILTNEREEGFPAAGDRIDQLLNLPWKPRPASEKASEGFVGNIGEKVHNISGVIKTYKTIEGDFGASKLVVIRLDDGHIVKFFGTGQTIWGRDVDERVTIEVGTVKGHETYQGDDQSVLTRVKFAPREDELDHFVVEAKWIDAPQTAETERYVKIEPASTDNEPSPLPSQDEDILGHWGI